MADRNSRTDGMDNETGADNEEMIRGVAEEGDDEFEDTEELEDEDEEEEGSF